MSTINEFFNDTAEEFQHPVLKSVLDAQKSQKQVTLQIVRRRAMLGFQEPKLYLTIGESDSPEEYLWDDDLNEALISNGFPMGNPEQECIRFILVLKKRFTPIEMRCGEGYFRALLVLVVKERGLSKISKISEILKYIRETNPSKDYDMYHDFYEATEDVIKSCWQDLVKKLKYPPEKAQEILAEALAQYLDERFRVTERQNLGWL